MRGIILAAGRGKRMGEATKHLPKCLLKVNNKTLLDYQITAMKKSGITEIAIVLGYQKQEVRHPDIKHYFINPLWNKTNSFYSLYCAREWLEKSNCVVSYSDIFYGFGCIRKIIKSTANIAITYDPNFLSLWKNRFLNPLDDLETFKINCDSNLLSIGEKAEDLSDIQGQYMGIFKLTPTSWVKLKQLKQSYSEKEFYSTDMTKIFSELLLKGELIEAVSIQTEKWGEVDHISDLNLYNSNKIT